jgi:hypothetical protein
MTLIQVIAELAKLLEEYGDIDVEVCNFAGEFDELRSVDLKGRKDGLRKWVELSPED